MASEISSIIIFNTRDEVVDADQQEMRDRIRKDCIVIGNVAVKDINLMMNETMAAVGKSHGNWSMSEYHQSLTVGTVAYVMACYLYALKKAYDIKPDDCLLLADGMAEAAKLTFIACVESEIPS